MAFDRTKEFNKDLDFGKFGEGVMIDFITEHFKYKDKFLSYWYSSDDSKKKSELKKYDLRFGSYSINDRTNFTNKVDFEIKTDGYDVNTGNLIFECKSGGKKSGVFSSESQYFIHFMPLCKEDNIYMIKVESMKKLLTENFNNQIISGGDIGSNTMMYSINRVDFDDIFKQYGGKIVTWNKYSIPERYNKKEFKSTIKYISEEFKKYDDDIFKF